MRRKMLMGAAVAAALLLAAPVTTWAHGFGDRYDLPVPLGLYIASAGAAVLLSFMMIGWFARGEPGASYPRKDLLEWPAGRALASKWVTEPVKAISAMVFVLYLLAGFFGSDEPNANLAPTMTWVIFWVGVAYFVALVGNVWELINPWKVIFGYAETAYAKLTGGRELARYEPYPEKLGAWVAFELFLMFAWVEIVFTSGSSDPFTLAFLTSAYSLVTFAGMWWFGRETWLRNGEAFSVVFSFFSSFAPTEVRARMEDGEELVDDYEAYGEVEPRDRQFNIRPWGAGLLASPALDLPRSALLVLMLSTVTFDGFAETGTWTRVLLTLADPLTFLGHNALLWATTVALVLAPVLFFGVFAGTAWLMGWLARSRLGTVRLIGRFALSLVPIALAYHIAHFFSFLMIQGQRIIALASDPFGWGWDLFGTADWVMEIGVVNARFVWFLSVAAIVIGHIVAVYVAHVYALRTFPIKTDAIRSQYPMMALMVGYTMVSLWIIAQPIVD